MYCSRFRLGRTQSRRTARALQTVLLFVLSLVSIVPAVPQAAKSAPTGNSDLPAAELQSLESDVAAGRLQQAAPLLRSYLERHPSSYRARYDLGYVLFKKHEVGPSIRELSKSLELDPKNAEAHKILALDCSIIGRYDVAETELQQAVRLKPGSAEIHYFLARTYYTKGVYPLAREEFETAIRLDSLYVK